MKEKIWASKHTISQMFDIPRGGLNKLLLYRETNGLDKCVRKLGERKLLIKVDRFSEWLDKSGKRGQRSKSPYQAPIMAKKEGEK